MVACAVLGCPARSDRSLKVKGITFHAFPSNPVRKAVWVNALRRKDWKPSKYSRICSQHFREEDIDRTSVSTVRIRENAVPSIIPTFTPHLRKKKRKQTPAPKRQKATKLEEPRVPSPVATPGRKCFVCSKESGSTGSPLTALTATSKTKLHQKLSKIIGAELDIVVDEDGVICSVCCRLLNYLDRIEVEHRLLTKSVVDCMRWTSGLGSVRDDSRMPEAVLASIEDHSKNSKIPEEKCELGPDVSTQDTSDDAVSGSKTVIASNRDDERKNQTSLADRETEKKKNQTSLADRETEKKKNQTSLADRETEKKKNQTLNADRGTAKKKNQTLNADRVTEKKKNQTPPAGRVTERKKNQTGVVHRVIEEKPVAEQDTQNYHCKVCNFESKHKSVFVFHLQRHLQSGYRCDFCDVLLPKDLSYWIARMQQKVT